MSYTIVTMYKKIITDLQEKANPNRAEQSARFFKTKKGQYAAGDVFVGISMPELRKIAKKYYQDVSYNTIERLLASNNHEYRMLALLFLLYTFQKVDTAGQKSIYDFYTKHISQVNNWDLVDVTAPHIVGSYLLDKNNTKQLYQWAKTPDIWLQRIAIVSTFAFIRVGIFDHTIAISQLLLTHSHDLIQKAVGWMLREVGKRDVRMLIHFLDNHTPQMPRTMLRYAIERLPEKKRLYYLHLK